MFNKCNDSYVPMVAWIDQKRRRPTLALLCNPRPRVVQGFGIYPRVPVFCSNVFLNYAFHVGVR